jgi:hypothetical protein
MRRKRVGVVSSLGLGVGLGVAARTSKFPLSTNWLVEQSKSVDTGASLVESEVGGFSKPLGILWRQIMAMMREEIESMSDGVIMRKALEFGDQQRTRQGR